MKDSFRMAVIGTACVLLGIGIGFALAATFWHRLVLGINDANLSNWLGFTGAILGALATVTAGALAYLGVLYSHAASTRDDAVHRITGYLATLRNLYANWLELKDMPDADPSRPLKMHTLQSELVRPEITVALYDSILQEDQVPVFVFCNTLRVALTAGHPHQHNAAAIALYIFEDVTRALTIRKRLLEEGNSLRKVQGTKFLTPEPYIKALSDGQTDELAAKKAWVFVEPGQSPSALPGQLAAEA
ncbi:hypothetical protein EV667_1066 [Ancylobacter aquaticus]|uniref:Uncharacterized protein n=1 Tax=Ancylobacter aquaticus TaxID=100 RepID=A0A4R1I9L5_ANCAQ|nr:hypothetical protein [Ancylobacter aquaticus]TCK30961.1 hypothetical protein EV667_1066 [Ancylobacter aquaticus]